MLEQFTFETFQPHIGETFSLALGDEETLTLELGEVSKMGTALGENDSWRQAFSTIFYAPNQPVLPQQIYELRHSTLGVMALFLVPVGPDSTQRMRYEAVFA